MAVRLVCSCGALYDLKDELAGQSMQCPRCGAVQTVPLPSVAPAPAPPPPDLDPAFQRHRFLLRQKHFAIAEKYFVWDEQGNVLLFVERPMHLLRLFLAALAVIGILLPAGMILVVVIDLVPKNVAPVVGVLGGLVALFLALATGIAVSAKRHVTFYRSEDRREPLLRILQDRKFTPIQATFSVQTPDGRVLAQFTKNYLYNFFRKRWTVHGPDGGLVAMAKEDSLILSLLRRVLPFGELMRSQFIIVRGNSEDVIGEFNRKFTLLDRYVLDMTADPACHLDRRIALALGVMLDTGERR